MVGIPTKIMHKYGLSKLLIYISDLKPQDYLSKWQIAGGKKKPTNLISNIKW